jgi:hypothetical protein
VAEVAVGHTPRCIDHRGERFAFPRGGQEDHRRHPISRPGIRRLQSRGGGDGGDNGGARAAVVDSNDDDDDIGRARGRQCDWETELFRTCWSEIAHLTYRDECDTGSLVLLPDEFDGTVPPSLTTDVVSRDGRNLVRPMRWLGRDDDWEIVAMERGTVAVRLLFKLGDIPELER